MRLVSWNLNRATWSHRKRYSTADEHRQRSWEELANLGADVALIQEAPPPPPPSQLDRPPTATIPRGDDLEDWRSLPGPKRWWCSALASWDLALEPLPADLRRPLAVTHRGAYSLGTVPWSGGRDGVLVVASVYALWDYDWLVRGQKPIYSETSLHRTLSDLTPILDVERSRLSLVVAGDLNASTQFPPPYRAQYRVVHDRLVALGLQNVSARADFGLPLQGCPCDDEPCRHIRTLEGTTPYQDDYIYASADVAQALQLVSVERTDAIEAVSDHYPLVVEMS